jgi:hypothetical protein
MKLSNRENVLVMVRLAAALAKEARTAGRATLLPTAVKAREATMRAAAIAMDVDVWLVEGRGVER